MRIKFTVGLPASGKSTWSRAFAEKNANWVRVSRDDLRHMRGRYFLPKHEKFITKLEDHAIITALDSGYSVIVDSMNLDADRLKARAKKLIQQYPNLTVDYKRFDVPLKTCIERDLARANSLGSKTIKEIYKRHFPDEVRSQVVYTEDKELRQVYIFDIDGTLADRGSRSPYDWSKVGLDTLRPDVRDLLYMVQDSGYTVILMSGRDSVCREQTKLWLEKHHIDYARLYMRPEGSQQKDSDMKREMFEEHIRGKFYCMGVFDDRDQVVNMWREELGIGCYQVNYGDF